MGAVFLQGFSGLRFDLKERQSSFILTLSTHCSSYRASGWRTVWCAALHKLASHSIFPLLIHHQYFVLWNYLTFISFKMTLFVCASSVHIRVWWNNSSDKHQPTYITQAVVTQGTDTVTFSYRSGMLEQNKNNQNCQAVSETAGLVKITLTGKSFN